jgi:hypothetical protein
LKILVIRNFGKAFSYSSTTRTFAKMPAASKKRKVVAAVEDEAAVEEVVDESTVSKESSGALRKITIEACKSWYGIMNRMKSYQLVH